jgi:hypothetical protein
MATDKTRLPQDSVEFLFQLVGAKMDKQDAVIVNGRIFAKVAGEWYRLETSERDAK